MNNMKCPFCGQELRKIHPTYVICDNCRITGEDKLWKALDLAIEALETIGGYLDYNDCVGVALDAKDKIYEALEQKDVK